MVSYDDAAVPVRSEFSESHTRFWGRLASAGNWYSARQRIAIAQAVRDAGNCALCDARVDALSPRTVQGTHDCTGGGSPIVAAEGDDSTDIDVAKELSSVEIEVVHTIVRDASRITRSWYQSLLDQGLTDAEYIEIVGTVVSMVSIDAFADIIGVTKRPLPKPDTSTQPSRYRPTTATLSDQAWVPMVPVDNSNSPEADLWPAGRTGNVVRAMSLVPDEVRTLCDLSSAHYLAMALVRQPGVDAGRALNRSQIELVAGRVSALNACYY